MTKKQIVEALKFEHEASIAFQFGYGETVGRELAVDEEGIIEATRGHKKQEPKCPVCKIIRAGIK